MPETRRLCRKCYKRRKLDASGRCRHCNPSGAIIGHGIETVTPAVVAPSRAITNVASVNIATATTTDSLSVSSLPGASRRPRPIGRTRSEGSSDRDHGIVRVLHSSDSTPLSVRLDSRAIRQMQMFADFFQSHMPAASAAEVGRARSISYLANIPFVDISSPLLSAAVDALCLAHVGSTRQDPRLLHASQNSYGTVLASIRRILSSAKVQTLCSRDIVMAIMVISLFDECMPAEHRAMNSSMTHLWGAQQYLTATTPSQFDLNHPLDRTLILNVLQSGFWLALAKRQQVTKDRPDWAAVQDKMFPSRTPYTVLALVPSMLEQTDILLSTDGENQSEVTQLCSKLDDIRHNICTRMQNDQSTVQPELVHITDTSAFDMDIEEHCFITSSTVFPSHYRFTSPEPAVNLACQAIIFLVIDCTLLRIFHFRPATRSMSSRRTPAEVEQDANKWAAQICQSVYQFSQFRSLAYVDFLLLFTELAYNYFSEQGAWKEAGWCQSCLVATQSRLERLRVHRPPTLCRLGGLPAGIKAAGRYRTPQLSVSEPRTRGPRADTCPIARMQGENCPVLDRLESHMDFTTAPSNSSSSTTASSVSPALSTIVPKLEKMNRE